MESDGVSQIILLGVLLVLSAFFSASETALMSLSKIRIRHMVDENIKGASLVNKMVENPSKLLGTILVGNNLVNIGASALATSLAMSYAGDKGIGIATGVMTILVLIFGEITPKSFAAQNAEKFSLKIAKVIYLINFLLNPIVTVLMHITNFFIKLFGGKINKNQPFITEEELKTMVNVSHEEGVLEGEEKEMINNVFEFGDSQVKDVMQPRTDMVAIESDSPYSEIIEIFRKEQFSRLPIYEENRDNIIGVLYIKDLMFYNSEEKFDINKYMREPYFTFEFKRTVELFTEMRLKRIPFAVVLDEYGGTAGIVTMEDLVEEIVGEIEDEYDKGEKEIEVIKDNEYIVDGSAKIDLVNEMIGLNIETEDFDSIGGFVIGQFGRLPERGEATQFNNIEFIIENIDRNRIDKLRIIL